MVKKTTPAKSITEKTKLVNINNPSQMKDFADELKQFVINNNLYSAIQEKNYVHVEGWQFAGASMGLFPIIEKVEDISPEDKKFSYSTKYKSNVETVVYKYRAEVKIINLATGDVVGYGVAICSNEEQKKNTFDEYAVASMAQTRAVGKAFRLKLGWVMKLAGYEPTTAEEMEEPAEDDTTTDDVINMSDMPLDDVQYLVGIHLSKMPPAAKARFLKDNANTVSDKTLDERQYRALYRALVDMRKEK